MLQVLYETEGRTQVFTLSKEVAFIGRANDNDIVLNDFSVSRRHAYLKKEDGGWVIYDNQSTNGVRVNDQAVPHADVRDGDQALIGTFMLRFRDDPTVAGKGKRVVDSTSTRIRPDRRVQPGLRAREERRAALRLDRPAAAGGAGRRRTRTASSRSSSRSRRPSSRPTTSRPCSTRSWT